jgi:hypothetical protein
MPLTAPRRTDGERRRRSGSNGLMIWSTASGVCRRCGSLSGIGSGPPSLQGAGTRAYPVARVQARSSGRLICVLTHGRRVAPPPLAPVNVETHRGRSPLAWRMAEAIPMPHSRSAGVAPPRSRRSARSSLASSQTNSRGRPAWHDMRSTWGPRRVGSCGGELPTAGPTSPPASARHRCVRASSPPILLRSPHWNDRSRAIARWRPTLASTGVDPADVDAVSAGFESRRWVRPVTRSAHLFRALKTVAGIDL